MKPARTTTLFDYPLFAAVIILCGISLVGLYSATEENIEVVTRHAIRIGCALGLMCIFARISPTWLARYAWPMYLGGLFLLGIVLLVGIIGKGAQRWLDLGFIRFQPAELMKIAVPVMVAALLTRAVLPARFLRLLGAVGIVLAPTGLIILQPDLGTALLIMLTGIAVIFMAGVSWRLIVSVLVALGAIAPMMWMFVLHDYQQQRVLTLLDPWSDPRGAGYHTIQSIIAIGSGGIQGKGWLYGTQSQLEFIPERSTDFIFAVYAEEFGLLGVLTLLSLYGFVVFRGLMIAMATTDTFARLVAGGLSATLFFYLFVNIGMVSGILPVVGVPLPLLSYGGTSMVTLLVGIGILMSIANQPQVPAHYG